MEYTTTVTCKCYNCNAISMEKIIIDRERIKLDLQEAHTKGFNEGYEYAKKELRKKLNLQELNYGRDKRME